MWQAGNVLVSYAQADSLRRGYGGQLASGDEMERLCVGGGNASKARPRCEGSEPQIKARNEEKRRR